jgi:hypothetical protein
MKRAYASLLVLAGFLIAIAFACGRSDVQIARQSTLGSSLSSALTVDECNFFAVDGSVRICHATGSAKNPYVILQVSSAGCVDGHAGHPGDYVPTATDLDCHGGGCFPLGAPVDPTIPCCDGLVPLDGVCSGGGSDGGGLDGGGSDGGGSDGGCSLSDGGGC